MLSHEYPPQEKELAWTAVGLIQKKASKNASVYYVHGILNDRHAPLSSLVDQIRNREADLRIYHGLDSLEEGNIWKFNFELHPYDENKMFLSLGEETRFHCIFEEEGMRPPTNTVANPS